jgi:transcription initiation factor TFIID TATA-box-binding protein
MMSGHLLILWKGGCVLQMDISPSPSVDSFKPIPFIHNIVATAQIQTSAQLQLDRLKQIFRFSSFNRRKFAAVTLRLVRPNCTILLFTSGKLVITGSKSSSEALLSAYRIRCLLRRTCIGQQFSITGFEIQNVVSHCELAVGENEILDIEALYERYHIYSTYQSHIFPGLIFRYPNLKVVALMFFSGKVVLTGAKSLADIDEGWDVIFSLLKSYVVKRQ